MTDQIKAKTKGSSDGHARYHDREWLTVKHDNGEWVVPGVLVCVCSCGNDVYVYSEEVYRRKTLPVKA